MKKFNWLIPILLFSLIISNNVVFTCSAEEHLNNEIDNSSNNKHFTKNVLINLQVDAELTGEHLFKVLDELEKRGYTTTVYVTGTYANDNGSAIQQIYENGHEIAFHGWATGEQLDTMNYTVQKEKLINAKKSVEENSQPIIGFRPQYFSQNEETYKILDSINISYNCGFISGLKYIPGHQNDTKPYKITNHSIYAVPISSYKTLNQTIYLCDISASNKYKLNGTEWYTILKNKFDDCEEKDEPMVVVLNPWITGNETIGYWQAFTGFLNYTDNKNISVVSTKELVDYYNETPIPTQIIQDETPGTPAFEAILAISCIYFTACVMRKRKEN
jgi:peptidoglycan/xylan/chitin deacetylase (PgdA/CDA1 family)